MGKRSRDKGARWERAVARLLRPIFGEGVCRGNQRRRGGAGPGEGCDVEGAPYWIECKNAKSVSVYAAVRQAVTKQKEANDVRPWMIVAKQDREPALAVLPLDVALALLSGNRRYESCCFIEPGASEDER